MIPALDPDFDYKALVRRAYDACAPAYDVSRKAEPGTELRALSNRLDDDDAVLDIGCGAGVPIARSLAARFRVTGVDISPEMIRRARRHVPACEFMCVDIMSARFPPSSFAAVVAFYAIFTFPGKSTRNCFDESIAGSNRVDTCCAHSVITVSRATRRMISLARRCIGATSA